MNKQEHEKGLGHFGTLGARKEGSRCVDFSPVLGPCRNSVNQEGRGHVVVIDRVPEPEGHVYC